ncbi:unnamed protein product [Leuciscus chuanchicus]
MLGTLDNEKKSRWKEFVKPLVHAYNCTRNDTTGYAPYELMFGRLPRLPVDLAFGLPTEAPAKSHSQYVKDLKDRLRESYEIAKKNSVKLAERNKGRFDKRVVVSTLEEGDRVLVRNVRLRGKHKLADRWEQGVQVVVKRAGDLPVYTVRPVGQSGPFRTLHRDLLLPCGFLQSDRDEQQSKQRVRRPRTRALANKDDSQESECEYESETDQFFSPVLGDMLDFETRVLVSPEQLPCSNPQKVPIDLPAVEPARESIPTCELLEENSEEPVRESLPESGEVETPYVELESGHSDPGVSVREEPGLDLCPKSVGEFPSQEVETDVDSEVENITMNAGVDESERENDPESEEGVCKNKRLGALERDGFGSITPKYPAGSPEVQAQRGIQGPENIVFSRRDVATLTEPTSGVPKVSRPRRQWAETPDRSHRDQISSDEEIELLEKERLRNIQEDIGANRRGGKHSSHSLQAPTRAQNRSVSEQNMTEFATGLMIGSAEGDEASKRRKQRYKHELLQQIAEKERNKRKEKELELRVAARGAVDPEKKADRIKQFGAMTQEYEDRRRDVPYQPGLGLGVFRDDSARRKLPQAPRESAPPERPRVAFQSPTLDHSTVLSRLANTSGLGLEARAGYGANGATTVTEDKHLSRTLGEIVGPRITGVHPPLGPSIPDSYQTPYDNAYYYYGARNPLDPNLAYYGPAGGQQSHIPPEAHWPVLQPPSGCLTQPISHAGVVPSEPAFFSSKRLQQPKESAVSYQEALKKQIQERQQRRYHEKVEKELYDAKIEAEMKAYEPWGRAGGGAPLRDDHGNLISDLKQMHKSNVDSLDSGGRVAQIPAATSPYASKPAGISSSEPPVQARGKLFNELPTPQQLRDQELYKECLKQQIEEKRRKEAEERERSRLEDEKEERRLAEQRARIEREYEEEQERKRQKEKEHIDKNGELIRQAEERRKEAEKLKKEEEEKEDEALRERHEREMQTHLKEVHRAPSPPLPALQKRLRKQLPRPPSAESHRSSATVSMHSMSAPHSPPVPARRNEIRATEEKQTVIRELSALRRQLRSEQRRLEGQLMQSNKNDHIPPVHGRYTRPDSVPDSQSLHSLTSAEIERLREHTKNKMTSLNNMREDDWRSDTVWIIGDSYVRRGAQRAAETMGSNLSLPGVRMCWFGCGGLRWKGLLPFFSHSLRGRAAPDVLLIHCGGNDLGEVSSVQLVNAMKEDLHQLKLRHPGMKIMFSAVTQRCRWKAGANPIVNIWKVREGVILRYKHFHRLHSHPASDVHSRSC